MVFDSKPDLSGKGVDSIPPMDNFFVNGIVFASQWTKMALMDSILLHFSKILSIIAKIVQKSSL
jgi:hypothetical protein